MLSVGSVYPQSKTWFYEVLHFWLQLIPFHISFKALETLEFIIQCVSHLWQLNTWTEILEPKKTVTEYLFTARHDIVES